ncbi:hypothetical protein [Nonomuraea sp. WAC 01424]|uniref:hypothetical protein n=1 Tax=Nonomuraea sp. WAC 01424 TaxID=2203200 RepID=UPI000F76FFFB|nr:hypothetical protein [Nonomuraea sp. WAC 01424]
MSGSHRATATPASPKPGANARRGRALMTAGVLAGTLMLATAGALMGDAFNSPGLDPVDWPHGGRWTSSEPNPAAVDSGPVVAKSSEPAAVTSSGVPDPARTRTGRTATGTRPTATGTSRTVAGTGPSASDSKPAAVRPGAERETRRPGSSTPGTAATSPANPPSPSPSRGSTPRPTTAPPNTSAPTNTPTHPHGTPPGRHPSKTHAPRR